MSRRPGSTTVNDFETAYLTERQIAARLGVSPRTLQAWRCSGSGPPFLKLNAAVRYELAAVQAWLAARAFHNTTEAGKP